MVPMFFERKRQASNAALALEACVSLTLSRSCKGAAVLCSVCSAR